MVERADGSGQTTIEVSAQHSKMKGSDLSKMTNRTGLVKERNETGEELTDNIHIPVVHFINPSLPNLGKNSGC